MVINNSRLGVILVASLLLNLALSALAQRIAVFLMCPEPGISLDCFDTLRAGMPWDQVLATISSREQFMLHAGIRLHREGHHVWRFHGNEVELALETSDGTLTAGTASVNGRVVRGNLQTWEPMADPLRLLVRRLDMTIRDRQIELLCYVAAFVAGIGLGGVLMSARGPGRSLDEQESRTSIDCVGAYFDPQHIEFVDGQAGVPPDFPVRRVRETH
jgi:hypothetical protein